MLYSQPPEIRYCALQQTFPGEGNFTTQNPQFVNTVTGDYHLRDGSPAIDRGSLSLSTPVDIDGNPRPGGDGKVDVGAYESSDEYMPGEAPEPPTHWFVKSDAPEDGDGKSWGSALRTIEAALNLRQASDTIWVASGTYQGHWILPPGVSLIGGFAGNESTLDERDLRTYRATLQNASTGFSVVYLAAKSLLDGFTVTGGQAGGVRCDYATPATVTNNFITGNYNESYGAGLIVYYSTGLIANNMISRNTSSSQGGGISSRFSTALFYGNTIVDNTATTGGGRCSFLSKCQLSRIASCGGIPLLPSRVEQEPCYPSPTPIFKAVTQAKGISTPIRCLSIPNRTTTTSRPTPLASEKESVL